MKTKINSLTLAAASLALLCATPINPQAATLTVTSTNDSGAGSLRAALASAANGDTIDVTGVSGTITLTNGQLAVTNSVAMLGPGAGILTVSGNKASRVFNVTGTNVTISSLKIANGYSTNNGAGIYIGGSLGSVVTINNCVVTNNSTMWKGGGICNNPGVTLTASNCIICGNSAPSGNQDGGGIYNDHGTLILVNSTFSRNSAYSGGGIFNDGESSGSAMLTVNASTFSGNYSVACGGAIYNDGKDGGATLMINASTFNGNFAIYDNGGGIYNDGESSGSATLTINASTFSGNSSSYVNGGGIYNNGKSGNATSTINTSTFSGNYAYYGGGIYNNGESSGSATLTINASTFSSNSADWPGGSIYNNGESGNATLTINASTFSGNYGFSGGGIYNDGESSGNATLTINASTFSGNSAGWQGGSICNDGYSGNAMLEIGDTIINASGSGIINNDGKVKSDGYNLSSDASGGDETTGPGGLLNSTNDIRNINPLLGPLQNNGGPTWTCALLPGSPAIDKGNTNAIPALAITTDQRGLLRCVDFAGIPNATGGDGSDVGAYEAQIVPCGSPLRLTGPTKSGSGPFQFAFTNTPGASFTVFTTTNLALSFSNWTVLGVPIEVAPGQFQFTDLQATNSPQRHYRVTSP